MPEVRWSVDGDELVSDSDYTIIYEDGVCLLKINQVQYYLFYVLFSSLNLP